MEARPARRTVRHRLAAWAPRRTTPTSGMSDRQVTVWVDSISSLNTHVRRLVCRFGHGIIIF